MPQEPVAKKLYCDFNIIKAGSDFHMNKTGTNFLLPGFAFLFFD